MPVAISKPARKQMLYAHRRAAACLRPACATAKFSCCLEGSLLPVPVAAANQRQAPWTSGAEPPIASHRRVHIARVVHIVLGPHEACKTHPTRGLASGLLQHHRPRTRPRQAGPRDYPAGARQQHGSIDGPPFCGGNWRKAAACLCTQQAWVPRWWDRVIGCSVLRIGIGIGAGIIVGNIYKTTSAVVAGLGS